MQRLLAPSTAELRRLRDQLRAASPARDDADRIERLRLFEELKAALSAAQALEAVAFDASQRAAQAVEGVVPGRQGRGVSAQIALALRMFPFRAQRWLGWAKILTRELPETFAELATGRTTEWRTMLVARETAVLSRTDRAVADRVIAPQLAHWGDRRVETESRRVAYRLDPRSAVARTSRAESERRVSIRPAPDTMCRLTALLPVAQGVAAYTALVQHAGSVTAGGTEGSRGQLMADTLVERLTGQADAAAVPVEIALVMTDATLLDGDDEPAHLLGFGPIPAAAARALATTATAPRWLRRLYRRPGSDDLAALDTRRRDFTANQRRFIRYRDRTCRTPWCDAPIRHIDHIVAAEHGGPTAIGNAEGLCEACNYAKQGLGWRARPGPGTAVIIVTPTGHRYASTAPAPPGGREPISPLERQARALLLEAVA